MENLGKEPEMIFSVGEYIEAVNAILKNFKVKIAGEITSVKFGPTGHCYFTIKDSSPTGEGLSVLDCIIWKYDYQICEVKLVEGLEVILSGEGRVYEGNGRFSFVAKTVELKGEGALKKAYDELKNKLEKEGVFAVENKKPLPDFPQKIGIITSKQGAVIHDLLNNLGQFNFKIKMVDSRVEGQEAISDLLGAIKTLAKQDIDVLVIMRGGGSLESLQAFNNETLIRAIVGFKTPVIAAIGHDKDVPLLALAADYICSTPTAAAHALNKSWEMAPLKISQSERIILEKFNKSIVQVNSVLLKYFNNIAFGLVSVLNKYKKFEYELSANLNKISSVITSQKVFLTNSQQKILAKLENRIKTIIQQLYFIAKTIQANDPAKNLALGYCIARKNNKVIKTAKDVKVGDDFDLQMQDGILNSLVNKIYGNR